MKENYFVVGVCFGTNRKTYMYKTAIGNVLMLGKNFYIENEYGYNYDGAKVTVVSFTDYESFSKENPVMSSSLKEIISFVDVNGNCVYIKDETAKIKESAFPNRSPVKNIWFNDEKKTTVVQWVDGTKTKVKASGDDEYTRAGGVGMCALKKIYGSYSMRKDFEKFGVENENVEKFKKEFSSKWSEAFKNIKESVNAYNDLVRN